MHTPEKLFKKDLDSVLSCLSTDIDLLRGRRIFVTGGTGFIGRWIIESLNHANKFADLGICICVLSRNPEAFLQRAPHLKGQGVDFIRGDVRDFSFPKTEYDSIIHAAADTNLAVIKESPISLLDTITQGTRRTLDFAASCNARDFLYLSSGAVYGPQPVTMTHLSEKYLGAANALGSGSEYSEGKRMAETLCSLYARQFGLNVKIARCFTFLGSLLPLDGRFAAGNFIGNALKNQPIEINGDGTPLRSYLYTSDLVVWLLKILIHGKTAYPYNVGSDEVVSIRQLAELVSESVKPALPVYIAKKAEVGTSADRYVPDVSRAKKELGLCRTISLKEAIHRTIEWYRNR